MDKRTLIFLFGITAIFFLMHQWYDFGGKDAAISTIAQPQTQIIISGDDTLPTPLTEREKQQFHIEKLYRDIDLEEFIAYGIRQNDNFLSIAADLDLPKTAYMQITDVTTAPVTRRVELVIPPDEVGDPYLYSIYALSKLETPWVPDEGVFKISMLYFDRDDVYQIKGQAIGTDKLILEQKPPKNAIALFDFKGQSGPYAIYERSKNRLDYLNHLSAFENYSVLLYPRGTPLGSQYKDQKFYVLENEFMQLVFSNINGALAEINLPFKSKDNLVSVVREIGIDRSMKEDYPNNDMFPQSEYLVPNGKGATKTLQPVLGGYYPLLRRDVIGAAGDTTTKIDPHYYAFNIFEENATIDPLPYKLKRFEKNLIEFELEQDNRRITKIYTLSSDPTDAPYVVDLTIQVDGDARSLFLTMGVPEVELISGSFNPTLKYRITRNQKPKIEEIKPPKAPLNLPHLNANWYCNGNGFFGIILDPLKDNSPGLSVLPLSGELVPSRLTVIGAEHQRYPPSKYPGYMMQTRIVPKPGVSNYRIFAGPFQKNILQRVDQTFTNPVTGYNPDYFGAKSYHGWFSLISLPFAKFLFIIMNFFHSVTHSWGISIILLTIFLRLMLYPLYNWSMKSTAKFQKISPQVQALQEKYKKDPKRAQMEIMNLYRKEGANPFGGCLPMLIQLPFLFGMFDLLKSSFELRGTPFIPGWINNLTAPDALFSWNYPIPFIGNTFHLLPVLLGVIMYFQQKLISATTKAPVTGQQKQQRMMGNLMTIVFTVLFYHFPSGLNIYWIFSMLLGILQQWWINKQILVKGK